MSYCKEPCPLHLCAELTKIGACGYRKSKTTTERIVAGDLPRCLEGGDARKYLGAKRFVVGVDGDEWDAFCKSIDGVMWVRYQGFMRDYDAEDAARDWEASQ